jgi:hypothetical protein
MPVMPCAHFSSLEWSGIPDITPAPNVTIRNSDVVHLAIAKLTVWSEFKVVKSHYVLTTEYLVAMVVPTRNCILSSVFNHSCVFIRATEQIFAVL